MLRIIFSSGISQYFCIISGHLYNSVFKKQTGEMHSKVNVQGDLSGLKLDHQFSSGVRGTPE